MLEADCVHGYHQDPAAAVAGAYYLIITDVLDETTEAKSNSKLKSPEYCFVDI